MFSLRHASVSFEFQHLWPPVNSHLRFPQVLHRSDIAESKACVLEDSHPRMAYPKISINVCFTRVLKPLCSFGSPTESRFPLNLFYFPSPISCLLRLGAPPISKSPAILHIFPQSHPPPLYSVYLGILPVRDVSVNLGPVIPPGGSFVIGPPPLSF